MVELAITDLESAIEELELVELAISGLKSAIEELEFGVNVAFGLHIPCPGL